MIQFYGAPAASSGRTHLMLEECGVAYDDHRVNLRDPGEKAKLREIHPGGKVPFPADKRSTFEVENGMPRPAWQKVAAAG